MEHPNAPSFNDDATSVASIVLPALVSAVLTQVVLIAINQPGPRPVTVELSEPEPLPVVVDPALGAERIYGRVTTVDGSEVEGYLRWNGQDVAWADVMQATRLDDNSFSGVRFGHIGRIERMDGRTAEVTLKSGEVVQLSALVAEGRAGIPPVAVEAPERPGAEVPWPEVASIELLPEPIEHAPVAERLHGTLVTRSGLTFTGYVSWDRDGMYGSDLLDLGAHDEPGVPFAEVTAIQRAGADQAIVTLRSGEDGIVAGTDDVGASNRGIVISDPAMGLVSVPWQRLRELRFHPAETPAGYESFDGGGALSGTVVTRGGEALHGTVVWDRDEGSTWDLLDGQLDGMRFRIELGRVAKIERFRFGARVELLDGRSFYLSASQDVNWTNRGIEVRDGGRTVRVPWDDFQELRLDGR